MVNSSYKVRARPTYPYFNLDGFGVFGGRTPRKLTVDSLSQCFAGAVVRQAIEYNDGTYAFDIDLQRKSHPDALNEIVNVLIGAGFQVAEAQVTEWTTSWVEGGLVGALGGGAIGGEMADAAGLLVGAAVGALAGAVGGSMQRRVIRILDAAVNRYVEGGWQFTVRLPQVAAQAPPRLAY